jgi:Leucine-rich repeat (LRR) protein
LGNNFFTKIEGLSNLRNLKVLRFSDGEGYGTPIEKVEGLENLEKLEWLDLHGPEGRGKIQDIEGLSTLKNLKRLDLSYQNISEVGNLYNLKNLNEVELTYNKISKLNLESSSIKALFLDHNNIISIEDLNLEKIPNLETLTLCCNRINQIKDISSLKNLKQLNLHDNQISHLEKFVISPNLIRLALDGNPIPERALEKIGGKRYDKTIYFKENGYL